jgi:hypothetical protein
LGGLAEYSAPTAGAKPFDDLPALNAAVMAHRTRMASDRLWFAEDSAAAWTLILGINEVPRPMQKIVQIFYRGSGVGVTAIL